MNRRESTNVKLAAIINSKNNDHDEEEALLNEEKKAMQRLRRSSLYGGGARTRIPKIKKVSKIEQSPYQTLGAPTMPLGPKPYEHSVPPGAHSDQFRIVTNPTQKSFNDPDRVCINSSSMLEELQVVPQPPWYCGNNNKIKPADGNHFIAANRYGYRGSRAIQQYCTDPWENPAKTRTENTPAFLNNSENYINEWVPPIMAAKHATINGLETPKLWPENTEYPTGYPLKKYPKSWVYKRETTVDVPERPKSPENLSKLMNSTQQSNTLLQDYARKEMARTQSSLPLEAQKKFEHAWTQALTLRASGSLKTIMKREKLPHKSHSLMDPSDTIKYSGSTAMIVHTQSTDELKFRLRMEMSRTKSKTPYHVKWHHVDLHYKCIEKKLKRGETMQQAIRVIAKTLRKAAMRNGSETSMRRIDFIQACEDISYFEEVSPKQLSVLYSLFDPMKKNNVRYVEIVGLLTALDLPSQLPYEKLHALWKIHHEFGLDRNIFDIVLECLSCCAYSVVDATLIEDLFKGEFRPRCYELAISGADHVQRPTTAPEPPTLIAPTPSRPSSPGGTRQASASYADGKLVVEDDSDDEAHTVTKSMSVQPQYNICQAFFDEAAFMKVLYLCPKLVAAFDEQLGWRLVGCHGSDDRYKEVEEDSVVTENHDFSWIMKRKEKKKEVFGLF